MPNDGLPIFTQPMGTPSGARAPRAVLDNIQILRCFAALLVVFVHLDVFSEALGFKSIANGGVDLFFVISGFIMVYTTRGRTIKASEFFRNRLARIVPIYWLITLCVFAVALFAPALLRSTTADLDELVKSLLFVPFRKSSGHMYPVLFVGWTLNYEMFFYAVFALGLFFPNRRLGFAFTMAALVALVALGLVFQPQKGGLASFYTSPLLLEFAAGMAVGNLVSRMPIRTQRERRWALVVCVTGLFSLVFAPALFPHVPAVVSCGISAMVVVLSAVLLDGASVSLAFGESSRRTLVLLGNASYATYLLHPFVTQAVQKVATRFHVGPIAVVPLIALTVVLVWLVGVATHLYIEKPLTRLAKVIAARPRLPDERVESAPAYTRN